jgi:uncharacterized protein
MTQMIFVNLPVKNLEQSKAFYTAIGGELDTRFCDDSAAMIRFSEAVHVMLLTHARFADFTDRAIIDAHKSVQVLNCLSRESREAVDTITDQAWEAGGRVDPCPPQTMDFMYGRSFADPDGHIWEVMWMDLAAAEQALSETV